MSIELRGQTTTGMGPVINNVEYYGITPNDHLKDIEVAKILAVNFSRGKHTEVGPIITRGWRGDLELEVRTNGVKPFEIVDCKDK